jgi:uncharacterized protein involved in exopolysaccharide biosynthesis
MENIFEKNTFQASDLVTYAYTKRKPILIVTLAAALLSAIVSLIIKPEYKSQIIFFPTKASSVSKALISNNVFLNKDILTFGDEEDAEKQIQILQSDEIKNRLIQKYNLFEHYKINPNSKIKYTRLDKKMKKNIKIRKTKYMSIEVSVIDNDPQVAASIATDIGNFLDSAINKMRHDLAYQAFQIVEKEYFSLQQEINKLEDSLKIIRNLGLYDYESQSKALNEAYVKALSDGKTELANKLKNELKRLADYGSTYVTLTEFLSNENKRLSELKSKYVEAKVDAEQELPQKFIVLNAFVPEIKEYPKRTRIVAVTTVSTFFLSILLLLIIDYFKKLKHLLN